MTPQIYLRRIDELVAVHLKAMRYGQSSFPHRRSLWAANSSNPGFTATVALAHDRRVPADSTDPEQSIVGIAYGFPGRSSSWWYREVHRGLRASGLSASEASEVLADYDEVSELHVLPAFQGLGVGRRMLVDLLSRLQRPMAMLSTPEVPDEANAAWSLYRDLGFRDVLRNFRFAPDPRPFGILARSSGRPQEHGPPDAGTVSYRTMS